MTADNRPMDILPRKNKLSPADYARQMVAWARKKSVNAPDIKRDIYGVLNSNSVAVVGLDQAGRAVFDVQFPGSVTVQTEKQALAVLKATQKIWNNRLQDAVVTRAISIRDYERIKVELRGPFVNFDGHYRAYSRKGPRRDTQGEFLGSPRLNESRQVVERPRHIFNTKQRLIAVGATTMVLASACVVPAVSRTPIPTPEKRSVQSSIVELIPTPKEEEAMLKSFEDHGHALSVKVASENGTTNEEVTGISRVIQATNVDGDYKTVTWAQMTINGNPNMSIEAWTFVAQDDTRETFLLAWTPVGKNLDGDLLLKGFKMAVDSNNVAGVDASHQEVGTAVIFADPNQPVLINMEKPDGGGRVRFSLASTILGGFSDILSWDAEVADAAPEQIAAIVNSTATSESTQLVDPTDPPATASKTATTVPTSGEPATAEDEATTANTATQPATATRVIVPTIPATAANTLVPATEVVIPPTAVDTPLPPDPTNTAVIVDTPLPPPEPTNTQIVEPSATNTEAAPPPSEIQAIPHGSVPSLSDLGSCVSYSVMVGGLNNQYIRTGRIVNIDQTGIDLSNGARINIEELIYGAHLVEDKNGNVNDSTWVNLPYTISEIFSVLNPGDYAGIVLADDGKGFLLLHCNSY